MEEARGAHKRGKEKGRARGKREYKRRYGGGCNVQALSTHQVEGLQACDFTLRLALRPRRQRC